MEWKNDVRYVEQFTHLMKNGDVVQWKDQIEDLNVMVYFHFRWDFAQWTGTIYDNYGEEKEDILRNGSYEQLKEEAIQYVRKHRPKPTAVVSFDIIFPKSLPLTDNCYVQDVEHIITEHFQNAYGTASVKNTTTGEIEAVFCKPSLAAEIEMWRPGEGRV